MKFKLITLSLITAVCIVFFNDVELVALNSGLSWTFSKLLPYIFLGILGLAYFMLLNKLTNKPILKQSIRSISLVLPFAIGFLLHPIYDGDFSKIGSAIHKNSSKNEFTQNGLAVVTIPDCPYCFGAIQKLKLLKKRNPKLHIEYIVCTSNKKYIQNYIREINGLFDIHLAKNPQELAKTADFRFPMFFKVEQKKATYKWSNDQFGVRATDEVEELFH
jgi:hypothetical protein